MYNNYVMRRSGEMFGEDLCTVDASVRGLLWFHKQPVVGFAVEIPLSLHCAIILTNCSKRNTKKLFLKPYAFNS